MNLSTSYLQKTKKRASEDRGAFSFFGTDHFTATASISTSAPIGSSATS
ncbi:hypothetical protein BN3659_02253 [Alistipes sp. CHKCI003]|nr:hypothetical protein BN3659_02253 [Alistipes sp. CHKCI003]